MRFSFWAFVVFFLFAALIGRFLRSKEDEGLPDRFFSGLRVGAPGWFGVCCYWLGCG